MSADFQVAWAITLEEEQGHNPDDHGSDTWYGIRRADNPDMPWPPSIDQAGQRAETRYWAPYRFDLLPQPIACAAFDWIFNGGPAISMLQKCLGLMADGIIGPETARAAQDQLSVKLLDNYMAHRGLYLARLPTWPVDGDEWLARLFHVYAKCRKLIPT